MDLKDKYQKYIEKVNNLNFIRDLNYKLIKIEINYTFLNKLKKNESIILHYKNEKLKRAIVFIISEVIYIKIINLSSYKSFDLKKYLYLKEKNIKNNFNFKYGGIKLFNMDISLLNNLFSLSEIEKIIKGKNWWEYEPYTLEDFY